MKIPVYVLASTEKTGECHAIANLNIHAEHSAVVGRITKHKYPLTDPRAMKETTAQQKTRFAKLERLQNGMVMAIETVKPSEYVEACAFWDQLNKMLVTAQVNGQNLFDLETPFIGLAI